MWWTWCFCLFSHCVSFCNSQFYWKRFQFSMETKHYWLPLTPRFRKQQTAHRYCTTKTLSMACIQTVKWDWEWAVCTLYITNQPTHTNAYIPRTGISFFSSTSIFCSRRTLSHMWKGDMHRSARKRKRKNVEWMGRVPCGEVLCDVHTTGAKASKQKVQISFSTPII